MRPIERISGPLDLVPRVVPPPPGERPGRRAERDPRRDDRGRKDRRPSAPRRPLRDSGDGHVDVIA
jgi:hypothetical protein